MSDTHTDPLAKGSSTSEGKLAILASVTGVLVALLGGVAPVFTQAAQTHPGLLWLQLAALLVGPGLVAVTGSSYLKSRTAVKGGLLDILEQAAGQEGNIIAAALVKRYMPPTTPTDVGAKAAAAGAVRG